MGTLTGRSATVALGSGVTCETWALEAAVIPAKAGIHSANHRKCAPGGLDSRFRGNDRRFESAPITNNTDTVALVVMVLAGVNCVL
jgi:hypothetical protein